MRYIRHHKGNIDSSTSAAPCPGKERREKGVAQERFAEGLVFYRSEERGKCFFEYIPGENAWVPSTRRYLYTTALWIAGSMGRAWYSSTLLGECIRDASAPRGGRGYASLSAEGRKRSFS